MQPPQQPLAGVACALLLSMTLLACALLLSMTFIGTVAGGMVNPLRHRPVLAGGVVQKHRCSRGRRDISKAVVS